MWPAERVDEIRRYVWLLQKRFDLMRYIITLFFRTKYVHPCMQIRRIWAHNVNMCLFVYLQLHLLFISIVVVQYNENVQIKIYLCLVSFFCLYIFAMVLLQWILCIGVGEQRSNTYSDWNSFQFYLETIYATAYRYIQSLNENLFRRKTQKWNRQYMHLYTCGIQIGVFPMLND